MIKKSLFFVIFYLLFSNIFANNNASPTKLTNSSTNELIVYVKKTCPHCTKAKKYLPKLAQEIPALKITLKDLDEAKSHVEELIEISRKTNNWPPGVPTFVYQENAIVGFENEEISGPILKKLLAPLINNSSSNEIQSFQKTSYQSELFGVISVERLGLPLFSFTLGILDGFNPCAMWVLLFLLTLLINMKSRKKMIIVAGTFVLISGAVYYAFMAAWLNFFLFIGGSNILVIILGTTALLIGGISIRDYFRERKAFTLAIPASVKPDIFQRMRNILQKQNTMAMVFSVAALAVVVNFYELLCTAGIPAIFTAVLANQELAPIAHYGYILLYIVAYIFDDSIMVLIAVWTLSSQKLTEKTGRILKLISGIVMVALGLAILFFPDLIN